MIKDNHKVVKFKQSDILTDKELEQIDKEISQLLRWQSAIGSRIANLQCKKQQSIAMVYKGILLDIDKELYQQDKNNYCCCVMTQQTVRNTTVNKRHYIRGKDLILK